MGERQISPVDIVMAEFIREQHATSGAWPAAKKPTESDGWLGEDSGTTDQSPPEAETIEQRAKIPLPRMVQRVLRSQRP